MATQRVPFTKRRLQEVDLPASGRIDIRDTGQRGLVCRVSASGARVFYFAHRSGRVCIGAFPTVTVEQARTRAKELAADAATGKAIVRRRESSKATFGGVYREWLLEAKRKKRTWEEDERRFHKHLAIWDRRPLSSLTRADVLGLHSQLGESGAPYEANRLLALVKTVLNYAIDAEHIDYKGPSPARKIAKFNEESRERFLSADELVRLKTALDAAPVDYRDIFLLCLFTGQRRGNVLAMRWGQVDFPLSLWTIPRTKNGKPHIVPLVEPAIELLLARHDDGSGWVFPAPANSTGHVTEVRKPWLAICNSAGISDLRIHDLRRTMGSYQAISGVSELIIGATLGHRSPQSTRTYARLKTDPIRAAMTQAVSAMGLLTDQGGPRRD